MKVSDEAIIAALLSCPTNKAAAAAVGLSETRLYQRMKEPGFRKKQEQARARLLSAILKNSDSGHTARPVHLSTVI